MKDFTESISCYNPRTLAFLHTLYTSAIELWTMKTVKSSPTWVKKLITTKASPVLTPRNQHLHSSTFLLNNDCSSSVKFTKTEESLCPRINLRKKLRLFSQSRKSTRKLRKYLRTATSLKGKLKIDCTKTTKDEWLKESKSKKRKFYLTQPSHPPSETPRPLSLWIRDTKSQSWTETLLFQRQWMNARFSLMWTECLIMRNRRTLWLKCRCKKGWSLRSISISRSSM